MRVRTEERIVHAFLKLYSKKEYSSITVKEICQKANVSRDTFYIYYEDINSMLEEIEDKILYDVSSITKSWQYIDIDKVDFLEAIPIYVDIYRYVLDNRIFFKALFGPYGNNQFIMKYHDMVKVSHYNKIKTDLPHVKHPDMLASFMAGSIIYASHNFINTYEDVTPEDIALMATKCVKAILQAERNSRL